MVARQTVELDLKGAPALRLVELLETSTTSG
jgi:hypothetical protein